MNRGTFTTTLAWEQDGEEQEATVQVTYSHYKSSPQTMIDPAEPASVEIVSITPLDRSVTLPPEWADGDRDEELFEECFADWQGALDDAAEWRDQCRRDDALMDAVNRSRGAA